MTALRQAGLSRNPVPAGRTDAGVHARMQVLSMHVAEPMGNAEIAARLGAALPPELGIAQVVDAPPKLNAAWSASAKEYRYRLTLADLPAWAGLSWRVDARPELVAEVLTRFVGTHDFWAFHDKSSSRKPRTVTHAELVDRGEGRFDVRVVGAGFARHLVRYVVGAAVGVATGALRLDDVNQALEKATLFEGIRAPAQGLTLWEVSYPAAVDPFSKDARASAAGVPRVPPFVE